MPINDTKEEDELWDEFKKTKSTALRDKFIRQYMPLVKYVAGKVASGMPSSVEFDDLVGYGQFGLLDAINKYDTSKNVKFKTYAVTRIRGSIFDELRQIDWVPRSVRQKSREIEDAIVSLESRLGRPATDMSIGNNIESPSSLNPDVIAEREEIKKVIAEAISELPEKEKMVIVLYYHEDLTFKEIGKVLEVSESRISQLHGKANHRLRAKLTNIRKGIM